MENLGDSLDLVPLGAWHGDGRKSAWWSPILLGTSYLPLRAQIDADHLYQGATIQRMGDGSLSASACQDLPTSSTRT